MKNIVILSALALSVFGQPTPARAEIYSWRDANGTLVLSNAPRGEGPVTDMFRLLTARVGTPEPAGKGADYEPLINQHSLLQGVRTDLVRAVIQVESAFNPRALSPKGAMGLMQLMPGTAARFGVTDAFNPAENIRAGVAYLKQLLNRYSNNEELALAAYNAGPLAVDQHGSQIPPYKETQNYVRRVNALGGVTQGAPGHSIYKSVDVIDGRPVVRYSDVEPASSNYQVVAR